LSENKQQPNTRRELTIDRKVVQLRIWSLLGYLAFPLLQIHCCVCWWKILKGVFPTEMYMLSLVRVRVCTVGWFLVFTLTLFVFPIRC